MNKQKLAVDVVENMLADDAFSQWLGIEVLEVKPGFARLKMEMRPEMTNGFHLAHGGILFSLADSALAFASNSHGRVALALENNISFLKKVQTGEVITATAQESSLGNRIAVYDVEIMNQNDNPVAVFRGTVFRTDEKHSTEFT